MTMLMCSFDTYTVKSLYSLKFLEGAVIEDSGSSKVRIDS